MNSLLTRLMRMFTAGKELGEQLFRRRVSRLPVLIRNIKWTDFQSENIRQAEDVEPEILGGEDADILNQALNDYMRPRHGETEYTDFTEIGPDGRLRRKSELWEQRNNGMEGTLREARVLVSSGLAVPHDQVGGRCQNPRCGKYEAAILMRPCSRCGRIFCSHCIRSMATPHGVLLLCPEDYKREVAAYDCWAAVDANEGKRVGIPVLPERPFAGIVQVNSRKIERNEQKR